MRMAMALLSDISNSDYLVPVSALTGALFGAAVGAVLTARFDHHRWLRSERSIAWAQFISTSTRFIPLESSSDRRPLDEHEASELRSLRSELNGVSARVRVLGPRRMTRAAFQGLAIQHQQLDISLHQIWTTAFLVLAQHELRVLPRRQGRVLARTADELLAEIGVLVELRDEAQSLSDTRKDLANDTDSSDEIEAIEQRGQQVNVLLDQQLTKVDRITRLFDKRNARVQGHRPPVS